METRKLSLQEMETVEGGNVCDVAVGVGVGLLVAPMGFGGIFVGALLAAYASKAFCSQMQQ